MKRLLLVASVLATIAVSAQTVNRKVVLAKGQQLEQQSKVVMNFSQEVMGQAIEIKMQSDITNVVEVKNAASNTYEITNTLKKVEMNMNGAGQDMKFNSEKPKDLQGPMGQLFKGRLGVPNEFTVNKDGIVTAIKKKADTSGATGMMGGMLGAGIGDAGEKEGSPFNSLASIPSKGVAVGGSWTDSTKDESGETVTTYTLKEVKGNDGLVTLSSTNKVNREIEQQGMTFVMDMQGQTTGEYTFDVATGIIKSRRSVTKATGTIEAGGNSIPISSETTVNSTINKK